MGGSDQWDVRNKSCKGDFRENKSNYLLIRPCVTVTAFWWAERYQCRRVEVTHACTNACTHANTYTHILIPPVCTKSWHLPRKLAPTLQNLLPSKQRLQSFPHALTSCLQTYLIEYWKKELGQKKMYVFLYFTWSLHFVKRLNKKKKHFHLTLHSHLVQCFQNGILAEYRISFFSFISFGSIFFSWKIILRMKKLMKITKRKKNSNNLFCSGSSRLWLLHLRYIHKFTAVYSRFINVWLIDI